ncbi:MAG: hypothetical protein JST93_09020 [Acidobacteria bacterium]|jgi:methylmalonyl-CoA carboxyltransferase large subunit|nr:hypothetical protein [Acidobacteriota bacterium]
MNLATESQLLEALESLRKEVAALGARVAALEGPTQSAEGATIPQPVAEAPAAPIEQEDAIPEEVLLVISAAIAAFLGKRPHIRQIRLIGSGAWAQQGRVSIQASHALAVRHE